MNRTARSRLAVAASVLFIAIAGPAIAQASRTWVSGVGDDANPCSRTAPCKTWPGAISKTAAKGEMNALDPGGFGGVTITKSIVIDGAEQHASTLVSGTNAIVINATADDRVILRNISINGMQTGLDGIKVFNVGTLVLENVHIYGFTQQGIEILVNSGAPTTTKVEMRNVSITRAAGGGVLAKPGGTTKVAMILHNVKVEDSSFGVRVEDRVTATVTGSSMDGSSNYGFIALTTVNPSSAFLTVDDSSSTNNGSWGVYAQGVGAILRVSDSVLTGNATGMGAASSGQIVSYGGNLNDGNASNGGPTSTVAKV